MGGATKRGKPTQRGNPHQLTTDQHVLPKASIERFAGSDGAVDCCLLPTDSIRRLRPNNPLFCASRVWDQRAEAGPTTQQIEADFQELATKVESGQTNIFDATSHLTVTKFFALVIAREQLRNKPPGDIVMPGRNGHNLSLDEQERLEKMGYLFARDGGVIESRMAAGVHIQGQVIWAVRTWGHWRWGVVRSPGPHFIVPDTIRSLAFVPIGPKTLLGANCPNGLMTPEDVYAHNHRARKLAERYYFTQDLRQA
jgi:hypothetical protein